MTIESINVNHKIRNMSGEFKIAENTFMRDYKFCYNISMQIQGRNLEIGRLNNIIRKAEHALELMKNKTPLKLGDIAQLSSDIISYKQQRTAEKKELLDDLNNFFNRCPPPKGDFRAAHAWTRLQGMKAKLEQSIKTGEIYDGYGWNSKMKDVASGPNYPVKAPNAQEILTYPGLWVLSILGAVWGATKNIPVLLEPSKGF